MKENRFISVNVTLLKIRLFTVSSNIKFLYNFPYDYGEICVLLKLLEKKTYWEQFGVGGEFDDESDTNKFLSLHELCFTCWRIHATCFQKLNNYSLLLSLWEQSLRQRLNAETSAKIKDWKSRIESLIFIFYLFFFFSVFVLGKTSMTDNLLKTLQNTQMSSTSGQQLASLTIETLEKMKIDQDFDQWYW